MNAWLYMLRCADDSFYVGTTRSSLERRLHEHNSGVSITAYTFSRRPVMLVFSQDFDRITDAIAAERQLKGWSRAKKLALVKGDFELLHELAKCRTTLARKTKAEG